MNKSLSKPSLEDVTQQQRISYEERYDLIAHVARSYKTRHSAEDAVASTLEVDTDVDFRREIRPYCYQHAW